METPKRIYLQIEDSEGEISELSYATWCVDQIHDTDVEYVRRDVAVRLREAYDNALEQKRGPISDKQLELYTETSWLAEPSPKPPLSPDGENGEGQA